MKKSILTTWCVVGGVSVGYFANKLNTPLGCTVFILGVAVLTLSIALLSKEGKR